MGSTICRFLICVGVGGNAKGFKIWAGWRRLRWRWQWVMVRSCCSFFYWFDIYGEEEVGWTTVSQWIIVTTRLSLYFVHNKEWALPCPATCYMYLRRQNSVTLEICLGLLVCTLCYYCCQTHLPTSTSFHFVTDRIKKLFHLVFGRQIYLLYWLWFSWRIFRLSLPSRMGMTMPEHLAIYKKSTCQNFLLLSCLGLHKVDSVGWITSFCDHIKMSSFNLIPPSSQPTSEPGWAFCYFSWNVIWRPLAPLCAGAVCTDDGSGRFEQLTTSFFNPVRLKYSFIQHKCSRDQITLVRTLSSYTVFISGPDQI